jgi:hypothetical protein
MNQNGGGGGGKERESRSHTRREEILHAFFDLVPHGDLTLEQFYPALDNGLMECPRFLEMLTTAIKKRQSLPFFTVTSKTTGLPSQRDSRYCSSPIQPSSDFLYTLFDFHHNQSLLPGRDISKEEFRVWFIKYNIVLGKQQQQPCWCHGPLPACGKERLEVPWEVIEHHLPFCAAEVKRRAALPDAPLSAPAQKNHDATENVVLTEDYNDGESLGTPIITTPNEKKKNKKHLRQAAASKKTPTPTPTTKRRGSREPLIEAQQRRAKEEERYWELKGAMPDTLTSEDAGLLRRVNERLRKQKLRLKKKKRPSEEEEEEGPPLKKRRSNALSSAAVVDNDAAAGKKRPLEEDVENKTAAATLKGSKKRRRPSASPLSSLIDEEEVVEAEEDQNLFEAPIITNKEEEEEEEEEEEDDDNGDFIQALCKGVGRVMNDVVKSYLDIKIDTLKRKQEEEEEMIAAALQEKALALDRELAHMQKSWAKAVLEMDKELAEILLLLIPLRTKEANDSVLLTAEEDAERERLNQEFIDSHIARANYKEEYKLDYARILERMEEVHVRLTTTSSAENAKPRLLLATWLEQIQATKLPRALSAALVPSLPPFCLLS